MNIRELDRKLKNIYLEMSETFSGHQERTGLTCLPGCGTCCLNPDIETTVLEMIPLALKVIDQGLLEEWLEKLESTSQLSCLHLSIQNGTSRCSVYEDRPSVCRMFGAAGVYNKHHHKSLSLCRLIREEKILLAQKVEASLGSDLPMIPDWRARISSVSPELSCQMFPINQAFLLALEKVAFLAYYSSIM